MPPNSPNAAQGIAPSLAELMVTVGIIAFEILAYIYIVRNYPVLPAAQPATR